MQHARFARRTVWRAESRWISGPRLHFSHRPALPAMVLGPGHISQAHVADEWVELEQLSTALDLYSKVVKNNG